MSIITRKPKSDSYKCASHLGKDDTKIASIIDNGNIGIFNSKILRNHMHQLK